jgi:hypothetical protein
MSVPRTYDENAEYDGPEELLDLENEDWLRAMSWDMWIGQPPRLVTTLKELREALADWDTNAPADDDKIRQFCTWPSSRPIPDDLRRELVTAGFRPLPPLAVERARAGSAGT